MSLTVDFSPATNTYSSKTAIANGASNDATIWAEYETEMADKKNAKIKHAEENIAKAKEYGHDEFNIEMQTDSNGNKTGNVIVTLNEDIGIGSIKHWLGIPDGVLKAWNQEKIEKLGTEEIGETGIQSHDMVEAPKGMQFILPGDCLNPQKTAWQKLCDFFSNLF